MAGLGDEHAGGAGEEGGRRVPAAGAIDNVFITVSKVRPYVHQVN